MDELINLSLYQRTFYTENRGHPVCLTAIAPTREAAIQKVLDGLNAIKQVDTEVAAEAETERQKTGKFANTWEKKEEKMKEHPSIVDWVGPYASKAHALLSQDFSTWEEKCFQGERGDDHVVITLRNALNAEEPRIVPIIQDGRVVNATVLLTHTALDG